MKNFAETLVTEKIIDVIVTGYIEKNHHFHFEPLYRRLYFVFEEKIFELIADGYITTNEVSHIQPWFEVDEDDCFCTSSIYKHLFKTEEEINVDSINFYENSEKQALFLSLTYTLESEKYCLNIDPRNFFGFSFSEEKHALERWSEESTLTSARWQYFSKTLKNQKKNI